MDELEAEFLFIKAELDAEGFSGSTEDENPDPRLIRAMEIITIMEVFDWETYKRIVIEHFGVPVDHFKESK